MSDEQKVTPTQLVRDIHEQGIAYWKPKREAMGELQRFLSGDRYVDDGGDFNRDRRGVQIRGQETQDTIRHVVAKATETPASIEARPIDNDEDPDAAEAMVSLVTNELENPWKGFKRERYAATQSSREQRLGVVWMDWDPDCGPYGEILFGLQAAERIMWDQAYHPHHPLCGWLIREKRLDYRKARKIYKAPWIEPDRACLSSGGAWRQGQPLIQGGVERLGSLDKDDKKATLWECWLKNDETEKAPRSQDGAYQALDPGKRYMSCKAGCGMRSDTQDTFKSLGGPALPETMPASCPTCGGDLTRIDAVDVNETVLAYSRGHRLIIVAPYSPAPDDEPCYDGAWPIPKARSFPGLFFTASVKPGEAMGPCDVDWMWDQQIASDNLMTLAVQRVFEHRNYWEMPEDGINDYRRRRFEFREDQFNIMFRDMTKAAQWGGEVKMHSGTGLDPGWEIAYGATQNALTRYRPTGDIGLTEQNSKDIAASTVAQVQKQGEVPTDDFIRRCNEELGMFYGVLSDYISATYTPERIARLNIDGTDILLNLRGDDLPNYDFIVEETPSFSGLEKQKSDAFNQAMQIAQTMGPEMLEAWGEFNNIPRSVTRRIQKIIAGQAEQQAMMNGVPGGQGMPLSPGAAPGGPGAPIMAGPSAGGIPSPAVA